ncbi:MAG TPA: MFS transporter [Pseudolabrys sp.]|jgi:CP family cyanate transporter-like MFS transporter|nr:MFS transporter [Pseudolabrys sp.]
MNTAPGATPQERFFIALMLLWLSGAALRFTILAVPPVIPLIHEELDLNATQVGLLAGLPSMLFAIAAVPGSLLIARLGVTSALVIGLLLTAVCGALRGAIPNVIWLYAMTIAMSAGVAVMQVTMPPAVRSWAPKRIGFATAVYTNGLLIGEILPVALMLPFVLPFLGGSWQKAFVAWSVPVAIIAIAVLAFAPKQETVSAEALAARRRWWPDWRNSLIWRLGIMLGTVNATYFGTNTFIPDYLNNNGQSEWISAALSGLNIGQLPASALLLVFAGRLERKAWPYMLSGFLSLLALTGIVFGSGPWVVAAASLQGFAAAGILVLILALPPLLSDPDDVHRVTAAMFTISYTCAVVVPIISGALWDVSGAGGFAFLPFALCSVALIVLAPAIGHVRRKES